MLVYLPPEPAPRVAHRDEVVRVIAEIEPLLEACDVVVVAIGADERAGAIVAAGSSTPAVFERPELLARPVRAVGATEAWVVLVGRPPSAATTANPSSCERFRAALADVGCPVREVIAPRQTCTMRASP